MNEVEKIFAPTSADVWEGIARGTQQICVNQLAEIGRLHRVNQRLARRIVKLKRTARRSHESRR